MLTDYADGATATIHGQITAIDPRTTQDNPWARVTISGPDGTATIDVLPRNYQRFQDLLRTGTTITVDGRISRYGKEPSLFATNIRADA